MTLEDAIGNAWRAVQGHRQRSILTMLGIMIGIASVILLTSIGEGVRVYTLSEFTQFGTNLVSITPGKVGTSGMPGALGGTVHPLTLDDALALRRVIGVDTVVPYAVGSATVERDRRSRDVFVHGVTSDCLEAFRMKVRAGRFLPPGDPRHGSPVAALGPTLKREIFGEENALGEHIRIAGQRFLVIGIMESKGQFLTFDIDDAVYIPISLAQPMFNRDDLVEIDVLISNNTLIESTVEEMRRLLIDRHGGEEDFTITTQTGMIESLDRILRIVSLAVVGIGAISLLVGAIGILTMMWISVHERTPEIGLAKAIGATPAQILGLYLAEAALLSTSGGVMGLVVGIGIARLIQVFLPELPVETPTLYVILALALSTAVGLASGILPARRAARLDPIAALAAD